MFKDLENLRKARHYIICMVDVFDKLGFFIDPDNLLHMVTIDRNIDRLARKMTYKEGTDIQLGECLFLDD